MSLFSRRQFRPEPEAFAELVDDVRHERATTADLVKLAERIDDEGTPVVLQAAFATLTSDPQVLIEVDALLRAGDSQSLDRFARRAAGPLAVAFAGSYRDGRLREQAVRQMIARPRPDYLPYLVLRCNDWARAVHDVARAELARLLYNDPVKVLPAVAPSVLYLSGRYRGGFAYSQLLAAALQTTPAVLERLAGSSAARVRRFAFEIHLKNRDLKIDELLAYAENDTNRWVRIQAADAVARDAVWTNRDGQLRRMAASKDANVRLTGLTGLTKLGHHAEVAPLLDDRKSLVRALARDAARREGTDPLAHYRRGVTAPAPAVGTIAGLVDIGRESDGPLLEPLLEHALPRIRRQAVRGLRALNAVPVEKVTALLDDPSPSVARAAAKALRS